MTGPKLNENVLALAEGQRSTKAVARYVKGSATKVRVVLDLIRGLPVQRADEVLQYTDRGAADDVRKVLASAVANAVHNDNQDPEELFVLAAFADEGPTLKRFRPRARGRASRIRKRTSHITVVVARLGDDRLEVVQNRQASSAAGRRGAGLSARSRAERVARSRQRAEGLREGSSTESDAVTGESDDTVDTTEALDLPTGAVAAPEDGSVPEGYAVKGNRNSMKFHVPGGRYYDITNADLYFDTVENAEAAGYDAPVTDDAAVEAEVEAEQAAAEQADDVAETPADETDEASSDDDAEASNEDGESK